ncbi:hypothetical protein ACS0TY_002867 [Phlomoides rotata]
MHLLNSTVSVIPSPSSTTLPIDLVANYIDKDTRSGKFKGKSKFPVKHKIFCHICGKGDHIASKCFKRFDKSFQGLEHLLNIGFPFVSSIVPSSHAQANFASYTSCVLPTPGFGNSTPTPYYHALHSPLSQVSPSVDWCVDSGATHYVTSNLNNM